MLEIDAKLLHRMTAPRNSRSLLRHVYDTVGLALFLTLAGVCCVVYTCFFPSAAATSSLPGKDATPSEIVRFILTSNSSEIVGMENGPVTRRVVSGALETQWDIASAAATKLQEPLIDMNWMTTGQDFELATFRLVTPSPYEVVAYLKGKAGETPVVTYFFMENNGIWRLSDVAYGAGLNPEHLTTMLQREIDAAKPLVTVPRGFGPSTPLALSGPAADAIKKFLAQTSVHCEFARPGRCALGQLLSNVDLHYVDTKDGKSALGLAFITYSIDRSGISIEMLAMWRRSSDGDYQEQAHDDVETLANSHVLGMQGEAVLIAGQTLGPRDAYCCPADPTVFKVMAAGGLLDVDVTRRDPRVDDVSRYIPRLPFTPLKMQAAESDESPPSDESDHAAAQSAAYVDARRTAMQALGYPADRADHIALDLKNNTYEGEPGELKDHNGSDVLVFERSGLIVYARPSARMAGTVHGGDVLFRGHIGGGGIDGYAYAFRRGCRPVPYRVKGRRYTPDDVSDFSIELTGPAPMRAGEGCEVVKFSAAVPNATLHFGFAAID